MNVRSHMSGSKLEACLEILKTFSNKGPLKLAQITYLANDNKKVLIRHLDFLIKQGLVEERTVGLGDIVFSVTQKGIKVMKYFEMPKQALSVIK